MTVALALALWLAFSLLAGLYIAEILRRVR